MLGITPEATGFAHRIVSDMLVNIQSSREVPLMGRSKRISPAGCLIPEFDGGDARRLVDGSA
jgi:hypothetical protein